MHIAQLRTFAFIVGVTTYLPFLFKILTFYMTAKVPVVDMHPFGDAWDTSGPVKGLVEGGRYWEARWFAMTMYRMRLHALICHVEPKDLEDLEDCKDFDAPKEHLEFLEDPEDAKLPFMNLFMDKQRDDLVQVVVWEGVAGSEEGREIGRCLEESFLNQVLECIRGAAVAALARGVGSLVADRVQREISEFIGVFRCHGYVKVAYEMTRFLLSFQRGQVYRDAHGRDHPHWSTVGVKREDLSMWRRGGIVSNMEGWEVGMCCELAGEMVENYESGGVGDKECMFELLLVLLHRPEQECQHLALKVAVKVGDSTSVHYLDPFDYPFSSSPTKVG